MRCQITAKQARVTPGENQLKSIPVKTAYPIPERVSEE